MAMIIGGVARAGVRSKVGKRCHERFGLQSIKTIGCTDAHLLGLWQNAILIPNL